MGNGLEVEMSDFQFWAEYAGLIIVLFSLMMLSFWVSLWFLVRFAKKVVKFVRNTWEE